MSNADLPSASPVKIAYSLTEASVAVGLSISTLRRRAQDGLIRLVLVGRRTVIPADDLRRLVNGRGAEPGLEEHHGHAR